MKIKYIDGEVWYERDIGKYEKQFCPWKNIGCGTWCPMHRVYAAPDGYLELRLCLGSVPFEMIVAHKAS